MRRLDVTLAATTVRWLVEQVQHEAANDCFVTLVTFVPNHLAEEAATDRHSLFCFFLLRPPKASPALFGASLASELSSASLSDVFFKAAIDLLRSAI